MKTLSFSLVRRNMGTLALSGLILLAVAYYTFHLLPAKTDRLEGRYYRVLARIGLNLSQQLKAQRKAHEGIGWRLQHAQQVVHNDEQRRHEGSAGQVAPTNEDFVRARWAVFAPEWPRPEFISLQPLPATPSATLTPPSFSLTVRNGQLVAQPEPEAAKAPAQMEVRAGQLIFANILPLTNPQDGQPQPYRLRWAVPLDSLVGRLARPDVFTYFFVVDAQRRQVLYSSEESAMLLDSAALRLPAWPRDSSGLYAGTTTRLLLQGRPHYLFVAPLHLAGGATWLLYGAVPQGYFDAERQAVAGWTVELGLLVLVLGMLSLPFLKIAFMGPRERLNREDLLRLAGGLVLGAGLLLLGLQSLALRHWLEGNVTEAQLKQLADDVSGRLATEVHQLSSALRQADNVLAQDQAMTAQVRKPADSLHYRDLMLYRSQHRATTKILTMGNVAALRQQEDSSDVVGWLDRNGSVRLVLGRKKIDYVASLGGRDYFQNIVKHPRRYGVADTFPAATYLTSVVSYRNARRTAVLARRSRWGGPDRPELPAVCFMSTELRCLRRPVLPPGFSFCVIDQRGEVLFHANPRLGLSENLLSDCEPADGLRAALFTRDGQYCEVNYQGRESRLWVQPLAVAQPGLFLVTMADGEYLRDWQLQTALAALRLLVVFWGLLLALGLLWHLVAPRLPLPRRIRHSFPQLWPRPDYAGRYWRVALGHGVAVALLYLFSMWLSALSQCVAVLLLPLYLFGLTAWWLPVHEDASMARDGRSWLVPGVAVLGLNALAFCHLGWHEAWVLCGLQGALAAALLAAVFLNRALRPATPPPNPPPGKQLGYQAAYSSMLLAWLVVLGVVPIVYGYQIANRAERLIQVRQTHLVLLRQLEAEQIASATAGAPLNYYLPFYLGTQLLREVPKNVRELPRARVNANSNRKFYQWLHWDLGDENRRHVIPLADANETGLPLDSAGQETAVARGQTLTDFPGNWYSIIQRPEWHPTIDRAHYYSRDPDFTLVIHSTADALVSGYGLFFVTGAPSATHLAFYWLLPMGLVALVALLGLLLFYLVGRVFMPAHHSYSYPPPGRSNSSAGDHFLVHRYFIAPAGSTLEDLPSALRNDVQGVSGTDLACLNARKLAGEATGKWKQWLRAELRRQDNPGRVLIEEFEFHPDDADLTERKRLVLEQLLRTGKEVVILSRCHPLAFVACDHPMEPPCEVPDHVRQRQAGLLLLDNLAGFRAEYLPLQLPVPTVEDPAIPAQCPALTPEQHKALARECNALPFLQRQRNFIEQLVLAATQRGQRPDAEHLVDLVHRLAQFHYRSLWHRLGPEEQFYLYDLAQDGLVNPHNGHVMETLLQKGYLRFDQHGRLLLCNDSFRQFAVSALQQRRVAAFEEQHRSSSTWAAWQLPLLLLLSSGLLFVFVTQRAAMTGAEQLLTALVTLLPLVGRLLASFSAPGQSKAEIRA